MPHLEASASAGFAAFLEYAWVGAAGVGSWKVPTAFAHFPGDGIRPARPWVEYWYNIARWTEMPSGGHFASLEAPELYVEDAVDYFAGLG